MDEDLLRMQLAHEREWRERLQKNNARLVSALVLDEAVSLLARGENLNAIKHLRDAGQLTLGEAKAFAQWLVANVPAAKHSQPPMTIDHLRLYRTAWSPEFECYVGISKVRADVDGRPLLDCRLEDGSPMPFVFSHIEWLVEAE